MQRQPHSEEVSNTEKKGMGVGDGKAGGFEVISQECTSKFDIWLALNAIAVATATKEKNSLLPYCLSIGRSSDRSFGRLIRHSVDGSIGRSVRHSVDRSVLWLIDR